MADDLSTLWANLSLAEGEDGELEIQTTEVNEIITRGNSCIVGKLLSERLVSKETIRSTLLRWWRPKGTFIFKVLGGNLFLIEFAEAKDKARVLEGRPWDFEGYLFLVEDFDGRISPSEFTFDRASFWVRMSNLPLACMGREVGFKLGAAVGRVEEVDTDKDGIGWGEFLRVKVNIDLYKPLSRGRMIKFDGKSRLIGFKFERLPKFCYHCGVICHGIEGCLKRSMKRNQETNQFGPWLRANSPTRRPERTHDRHADFSESFKTAKDSSREEPKQSDGPGRKPGGRKWQAAESGGNSETGEDSLGRYAMRTNKGSSGSKGGNQGDNYGTDQIHSQLIKEGNLVGVMAHHFEKQSVTKKAARIQSNDGKIKEVLKAGDHAGYSSQGNHLLSQNGPRREGPARESPLMAHVQLGEKLTSPGGPYPGPLLADIEKTMKGAQRGNVITKRKLRDEDYEVYNGELFPPNSIPQLLEGDFSENGLTKKGRLGAIDTENDCSDGSGKAEAGGQPRRPL